MPHRLFTTNTTILEGIPKCYPGKKRVFDAWCAVPIGFSPLLCGLDCWYREHIYIAYVVDCAHQHDHSPILDLSDSFVGYKEQAEAYSGASLADATGGAGAPPSEKLNFKDLNRQDVEAQDIDEGVDDDEDDDDDDKAFDDEYDQDSSYEDDYQDEMRKVPDEEKTPVTIVTGFLGAGKTTLVNYILKEQVINSFRPIVVIAWECMYSAQ